MRAAISFPPVKTADSFARAVLADPAIFVLDEATSSIDTQTEQLIQNATMHLLEGRTSFLIAHRLSTIRQADLILVVKDGKIVEQGKHEELLRKGGYYHDLYSKAIPGRRDEQQVKQLISWEIKKRYSVPYRIPLFIGLFDKMDRILIPILRVNFMNITIQIHLVHAKITGIF